MLIDASPGLGVHNPVVAWSYQVATHIVTVAPARRATVKQLELLLGHLAHDQATKPVTAVLNQVPDRSPAVDAILRAARSLADGRDLHEVPYDATLDFLVDAANLEIARLAQPTRVALKELAVHPRQQLVTGDEPPMSSFHTASYPSRPTAPIVQRAREHWPALAPRGRARRPDRRHAAARRRQRARISLAIE